MHGIFFIRVDAVNETFYELVAKPIQEPQAEEQQEDAVEHAPKKLLTPLTCKASPGA
jgi:hypothetical protein